MCTYYEKLCFVKNKTIQYLNQIFKVYGNELLLRLADVNLLSNENNCLETSTAIGFVLEEFITSKLETYTKHHNNTSEIRIQKPTGKSTVSLSYDCYVNYDDIVFLINIKTQKKGSSNSAVASINKLHTDYVLNNPAQEKAFLVLKTYYDFDISKTDQQRKIFINDVLGYFLEEIDLTKEYKQDHRNWSEEFNPSSGRLMISDTFRKTHSLNYENISYMQTYRSIENICKK